MDGAELIVFADATQLARAAAERIRRQASDDIAARGRFTWALAGGSTPEKTYRLLADGRQDQSLDWSKTYLFFGDERFVAHDDPRSNYHMVRQSLLDHAPIADDHVFAIPTDVATPAQSAQQYAQTLCTFFGASGAQMPKFDLILLGLGDDGHTASLFPGAAALDVQDAPVTWSPPGVLPPPVDRVTLTFAAINAARHVLFLVAGANKAEAFRDVWQQLAAWRDRPAAGVRPLGGQLTWLVDASAAALIRKAD